MPQDQSADNIMFAIKVLLILCLLILLLKVNALHVIRDKYYKRRMGKLNTFLTYLVSFPNFPPSYPPFTVYSIRR